MNLDTTYFERCIATLSKAYSLLSSANPDHIEYDLYRSACIKEFEIILELSGKLLKKVLKPFYHSSKEVDKLHFKDIFRQAGAHDIINAELIEHFLVYRDNRNSTANDYGINFAEETLILLSQFIQDTTCLAKIIQQQNNDN